MKCFRIAALALTLAATGCAQLSEQPAPAPQAPPAAAAPKPAAVPDRPSLPQIELTEELMFKMMVAEVAVQRGHPHVAVPAYLELARETGDPRIAQRATELAWNARFTEAALEAATLWLKAEPTSTRARQVLASLLVNQKKLEAARSHFEQWLASDSDNVGQNFLQLSNLLSRHPDRKAVLELLRGLVEAHRKVPEARLTLAQAAWNAGEAELAAAESAAALELKPGWELAALFSAQALQRRSNEEALAFLRDYLKSWPDGKDARLTYARLLVTTKRYPEARRQFEVLLKQHPENADVTMAVALLAMQAEDYAGAEGHLKRALEMGYAEPDVARLYLGQAAEGRERYDEALQWYSRVQPGEHYISAQTRYAGVLAKQGRLADARRHLQQVEVSTAQQRIQLAQAEAQLLRDANEHREAYEFLGRLLQKMPDHPDLLYDHAMAAEKVERIDVLEKNLRRLIQLRPDHAHAYNALGYTFADRSERLPEAFSLIEQALELAPDDPFIMDSMGWVLYRMGRGEEGLDYLRRAYLLRPDAEIGAHLGEVLWVLGRQDEARKVWADALKAHGSNEVLRNTIKRFAPVILPASR
jgi:tetratricopeptide (TPR) repeat protein